MVSYMNRSSTRPRLRLSHTTIAVSDLDKMLRFYCEILGFRVTNRGTVGPDGGEMAFISQDPTEHHQIVFVAGSPGEHQFVMVDHLAFRTSTLDDLRSIGEALAAADVEGVIPISHGNAWSLYFNDPEGNGLECFVDSPFHIAQPYADGLDLGASNNEIEASTLAGIETSAEFMSLKQWQSEFAAKLRNSTEA